MAYGALQGCSRAGGAVGERVRAFAGPQERDHARLARLEAEDGRLPKDRAPHLRADAEARFGFRQSVARAAAALF